MGFLSNLSDPAVGSRCGGGAGAASVVPVSLYFPVGAIGYVCAFLFAPFSSCFLVRNLRRRIFDHSDREAAYGLVSTDTKKRGSDDCHNIQIWNQQPNDMPMIRYGANFIPAFGNIPANAKSVGHPADKNFSRCGAVISRFLDPFGLL